MKIQESTENYLETILILQKKLEHVRSIDIANKLGFSKPSVSDKMKKFRELKFIQVDSNGYITLTNKGIAIAEKVYERHVMIAEIFIMLGVDEEVAYQDSCRIEHVLSDETFDCIKKYYVENKK